MLLDDSLRQLGRRLFRWRSWTFLLPAGLLLLERDHFHYAFGSSTADTLIGLGFLAVSLAGLAVRALTVGYILKGTSGRNTSRQKARHLNSTGTYSIVRNPLYLGNYLVLVGISLLSQRWEIVVINTLLFIAAYVPIILAEEYFLLQAFGQEYRDYADRVPCLLPRPWLWRPPVQAWSWRMVLRREHDSLFSIILAFVLVDLVREYAISGQFRVGLTWLIVGAAGAAVWGTLKVMKRWTDLLKPADGPGEHAEAPDAPGAPSIPYGK